MTPLTLIATRTSHFARKVRIFLDELALQYELRIVTNILTPDPKVFGGNPLMQVPVLIDGQDWHVDSDLIAQHIVRTRDPRDRLNVLCLAPDEAKQLAIRNGLMANEVTLLLIPNSAARNGQRYLEKLKHSTHAALTWLDTHIQVDRPTFDYLDITTVCMWQHHVHFALGPADDEFPRITERVNRFARRPSVLASTAG